MLQRLNTGLGRSVWLPLLLSAGLLGGCGGSSSEEDTGALYISLTDAEGDFNQYAVDVTSLRLYRPNGAVVETLPSTTRLDFTRYIDVSEFITAATVPSGAYTRAEITLDFDEAEITVENADGNSVPGTPVDGQGEALGSLTLTATINGGEGFVVSPGQLRDLTIDFDLEASNDVTLADDGQSATVVVKPVLSATTQRDFDDEKLRRARGLLDRVDTENRSFVIDIRPFQVRHRSHGELTVWTDDDTRFEIDGVAYTGDEGLSALAALGTGTPVVTLGRFDSGARRYRAEEVFAGESVPWDDRDAARGSVIARDSNRLTLLGAAIETGNGVIRFNDELTVLIDEGTRVHKQGSTDSADITDISIGQRISVIGRFNDEGELDATGNVEGVVRMKYSDLAASVVDKGNGLVVDLQSINNRSVSRFDFTGTGSDAANDADPDAYEVDTGTLPLHSIDLSDPVWIRGFPTAFGSAPPDFEAKTVIDVSSMLTKMLISWEPDGSTTAIAELDGSGLLPAIEDAGKLHHLKRAGVLTDLSDLQTLPRIVPQHGKPGLYMISEGPTVSVFHDWSHFAGELQQRLEEGSPVLLITAQGRYDPQAAELASRKVVVRLGGLAWPL